MPNQHSDALQTSLLFIEILRLIPKQYKITAKAIQQQLAKIGYERDVRTIQRHLETLSSYFSIERDERSKPYGYRWMWQAQGLSLPQVTLPESLLLLLAHEQLNALLPSGLRTPLQGVLQHASVLVGQSARQSLAKQWLNKVRVLPTSLPLLPPAIRSEVLDIISNALYHNHYLQLHYRNSREESKHKRVMPLGLAQQGVRLYLVARFDGYDNQRILALHRIDEVVDTGEVFDYPADFSLIDYDLAGHFGFGDGRRVHISFCITLDAGFHLTETPLSQDQVINRHNDHYKVSATLIDSQLLTAWLNGWGDKVWAVQKEQI